MCPSSKKATNQKNGAPKSAAFQSSMKGRLGLAALKGHEAPAIGHIIEGVSAGAVSHLGAIARSRKTLRQVDAGPFQARLPFLTTRHTLSLLGMFAVGLLS